MRTDHPKSVYSTTNVVFAVSIVTNQKDRAEPLNLPPRQLVND